MIQRFFVGASRFELPTSRSRTVRSIRAEPRPADAYYSMVSSQIWGVLIEQISKLHASFCSGTAVRSLSLRDAVPAQGNHSIGDLTVNHLARSGDRREQSDSGGSVFGKGVSLPVGARHAVPARGNTSIQVQATHASLLQVGVGRLLFYRCMYQG